MTDEEIAAQAEALMREHPDGATAKTLKRVQAYIDTGDLEMAAVWGRVAALISTREAERAVHPVKMMM